MMENLKMVALILGVIIAVLLIIAVALAIAGLIWWGIGAFIVWAFGINFVWTFWHGVALAIIMYVLGGIFTVNVKVKKED